MPMPRIRPPDSGWPPLWWPAHLRELAHELLDVRHKASVARRVLAVHASREQSRAASIPPGVTPTPEKGTEGLVLQQVLRAYEDEITHLVRRIVTEHGIMVAMLDLDGDRRRDPLGGLTDEAPDEGS